MKIRLILGVLLLTTEILAQKADTLYFQSANKEFFSPSDREYFSKYFDQNKNGIILYSNEEFNLSLFEKINEYRVGKTINPLRFSIRLDTLGKKVLYWLHYDSITNHFTSIDQMKPFRDLMNIENIQYFRAHLNSKFTFSTDEIIQGWIQSPKHNRNLLFGDLIVGGAMSLAKITMQEDGMEIEIFSVFEGDYATSNRELTEKVDSINKVIHRRPIKIVRPKN